MDPISIATAVVAFLSPYLIEGGKAAAKKGGEGLIAALDRRFKGKPAAEEALQDVKAAPQDADAQAALRLQLKKSLAADTEFLAELTRLLAEARGSIAATAKDSSIAVGGDVGGDVLGPGAQKGGTAIGTVGGDVYVGSRPDDPRPSDLRLAYLNHVFETAGALSLSGIDPKAASEAETRLNLGAVYTALLTLTSEECERAQGGRMQKESRFTPEGRARERVSALTQLNRQPRLVLLGDPGSGKSTFVNFVALCLAGEALGREEANLARLTEPLPQDDDDRDEKPQPQPWSCGPLLPVRVLLRDFAARGLPPVGERATAKHLWDFIAAELEDAALGDYAPRLAQELLKQGGMLLLDGLDEAPEADRRRVQIKQAVEDFAATFRHCRVLITSRTYAYQQQAWRLPGFAETVLAPFGAGQIRRFVDRWYVHIAQLRGLHSDDAQGRAELLKRAIFGSDRLRGLAERPLLLTLMASLHAWHGGSLPDRREKLYADAVDLLLDWWEQPKMVRDTEGRVTVQQPSLAEWLQVDRARVRGLLNELAYQAHAAQPDMVGTADVPEGDLLSGLMRLSQNPEVQNNLALLVSYLSQRAGLLLPRGVGVYTFPHRTFQEYLAACYLTDHGFPEKVAELARVDPNRWREAALLAGAKSARGSDFALWALVEALCYQDVGQDDILPPADAWGALLAGQALVESADLAQVSERNQAKVARVQAHLVRVLEEGQLPAVERAAAGRALARLGDPRFRPDAWYLPDEPALSTAEGPMLGFVEIPAGEFLMGTQKDDIPALMERFGGQREWYEWETPQHALTLPAYYIARYPVTVSQFRAFVEASGYKPEDEDSLKGVDTHPVVNVTWHESLKYCQWLTERLRESASQRIDESASQRMGELANEGERQFWEGLAGGKLAATLPSEAQWEKAARGGLPPASGGDRGGARIYPWGNDPDPNRANYDETGIGTTSAVGCFPGGASPYGVEDLSGNVWEWCCTKWEDSYENYQDDNDLEGSALRVLRGGSFASSQRYVRCACRSWFNPHNHFRNYGFRVVVASPSALYSELSEL